jgi:hypothetical protein
VGGDEAFDEGLCVLELLGGGCFVDAEDGLDVWVGDGLIAQEGGALAVAEQGDLFVPAFDVVADLAGDAEAVPGVAE